MNGWRHDGEVYAEHQTIFRVWDECCILWTSLGRKKKTSASCSSACASFHPETDPESAAVPGAGVGKYLRTSTITGIDGMKGVLIEDDDRRYVKELHQCFHGGDKDVIFVEVNEI